MTELVNAIDSWPKALVAISVVVATVFVIAIVASVFKKA